MGFKDLIQLHTNVSIMDTTWYSVFSLRLHHSFNVHRKMILINDILIHAYINPVPNEQYVMNSKNWATFMTIVWAVGCDFCSSFKCGNRSFLAALQYESLLLLQTFSAVHHFKCLYSLISQDSCCH